MASISRFRIRHFICVVTSRKTAIVTCCFKIIYCISTQHTSLIIKQIVNISDRPVAVRVLPRLNSLLSLVIMDILVKFERDVKYAKLYIPEVEDNIPDDIRRSVCSKSESKASALIR